MAVPGYILLDPPVNDPPYLSYVQLSPKIEHRIIKRHIHPDHDREPVIRSIRPSRSVYIEIQAILRDGQVVCGVVLHTCRRRGGSFEFARVVDVRLGRREP